MKQYGRRRAHGRTGSVMLEFVLGFPIVLVLMLACIQIAHLYIAKQVVHYAAFCAARAALVTVCGTTGPSTANDSWPTGGQLGYTGLANNNSQGSSIAAGRGGRARSEAEWVACKAAASVCATIATWDLQSPADVDQKTRATVSYAAAQPWNVEVTVEHDFALIVPLVGPLLGWGVNPWDATQPWAVQRQDETQNRWGVFPHIRLAETVILPKPYETIIAAGNWASGGAW